MGCRLALLLGLCVAVISCYAAEHSGGSVGLNAANCIDALNAAIAGNDIGQVRTILAIIDQQELIGCEHALACRAIREKRFFDIERLFNRLSGFINQVPVDKNGLTPLDWALYVGNPEIIRLITYDKRAGYRLLLHQAYKYRYLAAAKKLIVLGANAEQCDGLGRNVLHALALSEGESCWGDLNYLHDVCFRYHRLQRKRFSVFEHLMGLPSILDLVDIAMAGGVRINVVDRQGKNPLHFAVWSGDLGMVEILLKEYGARARSYDFFGYSPLHYAAARGQNGIAALLLDEQCNEFEKDEEGKTALYWMLKFKNQAAIRHVIAAYGLMRRESDEEVTDDAVAE
ncbi:MAG: ankyrin repeat domain-containing protein [Epsilonproteobacteria bacterium]|nr:ankyrin repeat domain-containing protein [Campylobacterota bacterium]